MDLSNAYDCLLHDLLIAKFAAYGFDNTTLALINDFLTTFSSYFEILIGVP